MPAKISYSLTRRPSQSRIATIYQQIIQRDYELAADQDTADVVILHHLPQYYNTSYALHPKLRRKYVISCCIAHAEDIPAGWKRGLGLVQEIWTCSRFCHTVLSAIHPNVHYIPYPIERDFTCSAAVLENVKRMTGFEIDQTQFLTIGMISEPRKNIHGLVEAFMAMSSEMPKAKLVIKAGPDDRSSWARNTQIVLLPVTLSDEYVNALYSVCTAYVSAHRCESWGLCMSDALLAGKAVIATAYSGNMDFMSEQNAFPVRYKRARVEPGENSPSVDCGACWASPDPESLAERIAEVYRDHRNGPVAERTAAAKVKVGQFDRKRVSELIRQRLLAVEGRFGS